MVLLAVAPTEDAWTDAGAEMVLLAVLPKAGASLALLLFLPLGSKGLGSNGLVPTVNV